jgi:hypothetical protein
MAAVGASFGQDVRGSVDRLLAEQPPDGGWNRQAANGSTRSSFHSMICVLEALLEHDLYVRRSPDMTEAVRLPDLVALRHAARPRVPVPRRCPAWRASGKGNKLVASKRDGRWRHEGRYPGALLVALDEGEGRPSRWKGTGNTRKSL